MPDVIRVGITGNTGFIGSRLSLILAGEKRFQVVPFDREWFQNPGHLKAFAASCDAVVHFAGLSRDPDGNHLYQVNLQLTQALADAVVSCGIHAPAVYLGSTTHIAKTLPYHASKRDSQALLERTCPRVVTMLMANTFGPGSRPFYNSVVSTFCEVAATGGTPKQIDPVNLELIYVRDLCLRIAELLRAEGVTRTEVIPARVTLPLPELWTKLCAMRDGSFSPETPFDFDLLETYRAYPYSAANHKQVESY